MRLPRCVVVLTLLLVPTTVYAHDHRWDFAFGPAWAEGSSLWGGRVTIGLQQDWLTDPKNPNATKRFSWLIDLTNLKAQENSQDTTFLSYLAGARWAVASNQRHILMVHGLTGITHKQIDSTTENGIPVTVGAAYEWVWGPRTVGTAGWAARVQAEHSFQPKSSLKGYTQISASVVKRFD